MLDEFSHSLDPLRTSPFEEAVIQFPRFTGVCKLPSRITQTGHGLSFHEAVRPKYEATPMAITTGMTTPPLANNMVMATRWPMD